MRLNTIRFKISVLYTAILGLILIIYMAILYVTLYRTLYSDFDTRLVAKAEKIRNTVNAYMEVLGSSRESLMFSLKRTVMIEASHPQQEKIGNVESLWLKNFHTLRLKEDYLMVLSARGQVLVSSANVEPALRVSFQRTHADTPGSRIHEHTVQYRKSPVRVVNLAFYPYGQREEYIIQVGSSLAPVINLMNSRLRYRLIPFPFILLCGFFIGRFFTSRILNPVAETTRTARRITQGDLSARVEAVHVDEEIQSLVDAFNDMITRLEKSFQYISDVSTHLPHELKTPLAIIRGELELALKRKRTQAEYIRTIEISLEELEKIRKLIEDLLLTMKLDYHPDTASFEEFDLIEFLGEVYEESKILAQTQRIMVHMDAPLDSVYVKGNRLHLRRLFFNVIDNALKFTPEGGTIAIKGHRKGATVTISIRDNGTGIKEDEMPKIFNKFYRIHSPSGSDKRGCGLGLSIAQSIATLHGGTIQIKSRWQKGTTVIVTLPCR